MKRDFHISDEVLDCKEFLITQNDYDKLPKNINRQILYFEYGLKFKHIFTSEYEVDNYVFIIEDEKKLSKLILKYGIGGTFSQTKKLVKTLHK